MNLIGTTICLIFMLFLALKLVKEIKSPTWKWNGFTIGLTMLYTALLIVLIYWEINLIF